MINVPKAEGIDPENLLWDKSKIEREPRLIVVAKVDRLAAYDSGAMMSPFSLLLLKSISRDEASCHKEEGIVPVKLLKPKRIYARLGLLEKMSGMKPLKPEEPTSRVVKLVMLARDDGRGPARVQLKRDNTCKLVSCPIHDGKGPDNLLFPDRPSDWTFTSRQMSTGMVLDIFKLFKCNVLRAVSSPRAVGNAPLNSLLLRSRCCNVSARMDMMEVIAPFSLLLLNMRLRN